MGCHNHLEGIDKPCCGDATCTGNSGRANHCEARQPTCKAVGEICHSYPEVINKPCCGDATCTGNSGQANHCEARPTCKAVGEICYSHQEIDMPCCGNATCTGDSGSRAHCKVNSAPTMVRGYQQMQHLNCYAGHGAAAEFWTGSASLDECAMIT